MTNTGGLQDLLISRLNSNAYKPRRIRSGAAGYDIFSAYDYTIKGHSKTIVYTDLQICPPAGTYARIVPVYSLAANYSINIGAGVIDPDYRHNVRIVMFNHRNEDYHIYKGDLIARLICEKIETPKVVEVPLIDFSYRNTSNIYTNW